MEERIINTKEAMLQGENERLEIQADVLPDVDKKTSLLTMEAVKPSGGDFIKDKPFDIQPVLQRISILHEAFNDLDAEINATDTSRITDDEMNAFNDIAKAFERANRVLFELVNVGERG